MKMTNATGRAARTLGLSLALIGLACAAPPEAAAQSVYASRANASRCMDVFRGSLDEGNFLQLSPCQENVSQQFVLQSDGHLVVLNGRRDNRGYQMCVDYYPSAGGDGDPVRIWPCHPISGSGDSQRWVRTESGQFQGASGRCIDVQGGNNAAQGAGSPRLVMWRCDQYASKSWDPRSGGLPSSEEANRRAAEERQRQEAARRAEEARRAEAAREEQARRAAEARRERDRARRAEPAQGNRFSERVEYCFGAVGSMCEGAPNAGATQNPDGTVTLMVSVGSILHDNCCLANPGGKFCGGPGMDGEPAKEFNHDGTCVAEWDKAFWNTLTDGRQWQVKMDPRERSDLTVVANPRTSYYQDGTPSQGFETRATRRLAAPVGTALDPGDGQFCESGRASRESFLGKEWIVCVPKALRRPGESP